MALSIRMTISITTLSVFVSPSLFLFSLSLSLFPCICLSPFVLLLSQCLFCSSLYIPLFLPSRFLLYLYKFLFTSFTLCLSVSLLIFSLSVSNLFCASFSLSPSLSVSISISHSLHQSMFHYSLCRSLPAYLSLFLSASLFHASFLFLSISLMENVRQVVAWTVSSVFMRKYFIFRVSFYKPSIKIVSSENTNPP